jgi:glycosyltransferase involved in cell wall biosynthesis
MNSSKTIVYVNYSPYENSGHILDYLLENFQDVYLFVMAFHSLSGKKQLNRFVHYKNGKQVNEENLFYMKVPENFVFILIPIRSAMNALQIFTKTLSIRNSGNKIDYFFTVNAFTATIGRIMKFLGIVESSIFWVWDYYPPEFPTFVGRMMRLLYWQFDKFATYSDRVFYLNHRMADVRKERGVISKNKKTISVPIGMGDVIPIKNKNLNDIKIGFIGVLKKSQGVGMLIDAADYLSKSFKKVTFEIIGSGPDEKIFKSSVKKNKNIKYNFYGLVSEKEFAKILSNCTIGASPYSPEHGTVSKYTDPGKPKRYMEFNLPVITTDVIEISKEIVHDKAGVIIKYEDYKDLGDAINKIIGKYDSYVKGALKFHKKYYYRDIYNVMFK